MPSGYLVKPAQTPHWRSNRPPNRPPRRTALRAALSGVPPLLLGGLLGWAAWRWPQGEVASALWLALPLALLVGAQSGSWLEGTRWWRLGRLLGIERRGGVASFRAIIETAPMPILVARLDDGVIVYANRAAESACGERPGGLCGRGIPEFHADHRQRQRLLARLRRERRVHAAEVALCPPGQAVRWYSLSASRLGFRGEPAVAMGLVDITDSRHLANQLRYQASHDPLTGLVNRREFELRLARAVNSARRSGAGHALCYIDLDRFKEVNDACGHAGGDELLRRLSALLRGDVRGRDTLARLGGDEFGVLMEHCGLDQAARLAEKLRGLVEGFRFVCEDVEHRVGASIGLVVIDARAESATSLLRCADEACYAAKGAGRNRVHIYQDDDAGGRRRRGEMAWLERIERALQRDDGFVFYTQPILPCAPQESAEVVVPPGGGGHCELLLRLREEDGSLVAPDAFMHVAERYAQAAQVDRWVVRRVLDWLAKEPPRGGLVAVNLSGQTLGDPAACEAVVGMLAASGVAPQRLCFEVTETATIANLDGAQHFLSQLKELGCRVALDDFGSGLSSYAYLKRLPVDYVKIDAMFVRDIVRDSIDYALVRSINEIAHVLGKRTIAEGVEGAAERRLLAAIGVDFVQGYGIAAPQPLVLPPVASAEARSE